MVKGQDLGWELEQERESASLGASLWGRGAEPRVGLCLLY